jgi:hypothetical protein
MINNIARAFVGACTALHNTCVDDDGDYWIHDRSEIPPRDKQQADHGYTYLYNYRGVRQNWWGAWVETERQKGFDVRLSAKS